jgi:hypothetical protein
MEGTVSDDPDARSEFATQHEDVAKPLSDDAGNSTDPTGDIADGFDAAGRDATGAATHEVRQDAAGPDHDGQDDILVAMIAGLLDIDRGDLFVRRLLEHTGQSDAAGGQLTSLLRKLRRDLGAGTDETTAFEQFIGALDDAMPDTDELARAVPVLAAATARIIVRGLDAASVRMDAENRGNLVRQAVAATRDLVGGLGPSGLEPLPVVARHLVRHAMRRGTSPAALASALPRIVARVSAEPGLMQRLLRTGAARTDQTGRGIWGRSRRLVLQSPVEITILAR